MEKIKLQLSAQKSDETLYTNWQISKISNDFSEFYYKSVLLHDISTNIDRGVLKNHVIIFNSSININNQYSKYSTPELDLSNPADILKYYHLGSPISLHPNRQILILHELFEAYRVYFSLINKYKLNLGSKKDDLSILYGISLEYLDKRLDLQLVTFFESRVIENNEFLSERKDECIKEIRTHFKNHEDKFKKIIEDLDERKPSKQFNYVFNRFERPIVGIKLTNDKFKLLGSDFFVQSKFTYSNSRFLETNSIKQNSPLEIILTMSPIIIPNLLLILREKKSLLMQQSTNNNLDQEIANLDQEINHIYSLAQSEGITLSNTTQLSELQYTVIKKGKSVLDELETKVI